MKTVVAALVIAAAVAGCITRNTRTRQLTGTCAGACAHYVECKPNHPEEDRQRCLAECPDVFRDEDSLMGFESLTCKDAVEYIDGPQQASTIPS